MKTFTIDFEAWAEIEAKSLKEAERKAHAIINQIEAYANNDILFAEPFEMVLTEDGVTQEGY